MVISCAVLDNQANRLLTALIYNIVIAIANRNIFHHNRNRTFLSNRAALEHIVRERTRLSTNVEKIMCVECNLWLKAAWKEKNDVTHASLNILRNTHPL